MNFREIATGSRVINIRIKEQTRELVNARDAGRRRRRMRGGPVGR